MKKIFTKLFKSQNFFSLSGSVAASGLGFLSFAILARGLDKEQFGNWMIFLTICTLTELLRTGLLQTGLIKFSSGKNEHEQKVILGTGWVFAILTTAVFAFLTITAFFLAEKYMTYPGVYLFFKWYWVLTILTLPLNYASWYLQTIINFKSLLFIRIIVLVSFILSLTLVFTHNLGLEYVVYFYIASQAICSLISLIAGWTAISTIRYADINKLKALFNFGKFSMGTMLGANLLRNSSTLLIGALLNAEAVAIYSVPLKLFEIIEIPLRSFVATALPSLSRIFNSGNKKSFSEFLEKSTGTFTILLIPVVAGCILFAKPLVLLLGGEGYSEAANILIIFSLFAFFMPVDRYSGIALDILNKPSLNFLKVILMLTINIVANIIAIEMTGQLWSVATVSILTFFSGVVFGVFFLKKHIKFSTRNIFLKGYSEIRYSAGKITDLLKPVSN